MANYVYTQSEINIAIKDKSPKEYFSKILIQCDGISELFYGGITNLEELYDNLNANDIPLSIIEMESKDYPKFLEERRKLMALRIKNYYYSLI